MPDLDDDPPAEEAPPSGAGSLDEKPGVTALTREGRERRQKDVLRRRHKNIRDLAYRKSNGNSI
jgi:hypothetical protein